MVNAGNGLFNRRRPSARHQPGWFGRLGVLILAVAMALCMLGCFGPRGNDTLIGGAAGAGGGALIGSAVGAPGTGAILGGLLGAGGGYLIGNAQAESWHRPYYYRPYY